MPDPSVVHSCNAIPPLFNSDHYGIIMELMGLKAVEDGKEVCAVFFDFRKAFNSIPHAPLM